MRRSMVAMALLVVTACSSDLTGPLGNRTSPPVDYSTAPCATGITTEMSSYRAQLGAEIAMTTRTGGDTTFMRATFHAPPAYAALDTVWAEWHWRAAWTYCMEVRSVGMVAQ